MAHNDSPKTDIHQLVSRVMADDATPAECEALAQLLEQHPSLIREYAETVAIAAQLTWKYSNKSAVPSTEVDADTDDVPIVVPIQPVTRRWAVRSSRRASWRHPHPLIAASLLLLVGGAAGLLLGTRLSDSSLPLSSIRPSGNEIVAAGAWSRAVNCSWTGDLQATPIPGSQVLSGERIALLQGVAELSLNNGTDLKVDGPTAMVVASASSLVIQHGSVLGSVPATAQELEISIPSGILEIGPGEFGLTVYGDTIEVHAFTGRVGLTLSSFGRTPEAVADSDEETDFLAPKEITVEPGQALRLQLSGATLRVAETKVADRSRFISARSELSPLRITSAYVDQVKAAQPVAYWRFESAMLSHSLGNEIEGGQSLNMAGNIQLRTQEGNTYLDFPVGDWGDRIVASEPFSILDGAETYSIEFWMRPNHLHHGFVCGLMDSPFTDPHGGVVIELKPGVYSPNGSDTGHIRFLHRAPPSGSIRVGVSAYSTDRYSLRQWQHVVTVKEKRRMMLYLDGKLSGTAKCGDAVPKGLYVVLGQLHRPKHMRAFVGQMDEFAIYDRALTPDEVEQHHAAVPASGAEQMVSTGQEI